MDSLYVFAVRRIGVEVPETGLIRNPCPIELEHSLYEIVYQLRMVVYTGSWNKYDGAFWRVRHLGNSISASNHRVGYHGSVRQLPSSRIPVHLLAQYST